MEYRLIKSISPREVAAGLCRSLLDQLKTTNATVAADLSSLVASLFDQGHEGGTPSDLHEFEEACEEIARRYVGVGDMEQLALLSSGYAKMGKAIELAGHLARENLFDQKRDAFAAQFPNSQEYPNFSPSFVSADGIVPGELERVLYQVIENGASRGQPVFSDVQTAVGYFSLPVFIPVLTQHPTNPDTLAANNLLCAWHDVCREIVRGGEAVPLDLQARYAGVVNDFANEELTPLGEDGGPRSFTPFEEIAFVMDGLRRMYRGLDDVYATFDLALQRRFGSTYDDNAREALQLNMQVASWAMGDKDGNQNIKAEHLLLAASMHRGLAVSLCREELGALLARDGAREEFPGLVAWEKRFGDAGARLEVLREALEKKRKESGGIDIVLSQKDFDAYAEACAHAMGKGMSFAKAEQAFLGDLRRAYEGGSAEFKEPVLRLLRKVRTFGFRMARLEMRETAEEHSRVVSFLMNNRNPLTDEKLDYHKMHVAKKTQFLDSLMMDKPACMHDLASRFLGRIDATNQLRRYADDAPQAIAYHTLKRLQLAAMQPDLFQDIILAECGGPHHVLEALALQKAAHPSLRLHITPLLEEFETLNNASSLLMGLFKWPCYRQHMLALNQGQPDLLQKIQVAHSDNVRRAGLPAARALIHEAHRVVVDFLREKREDIQDLFAEDVSDKKRVSVNIQWFEGGSVSDPLRNGVRSFSSMVDTLGLARCTKSTFQGGDLQNYLCYGTSVRRFLTRFFVHNAKNISAQDHGLRTQNEGVLSHAEKGLIETAVGEALQGCHSDYRFNHFGESSPIGYLFAHPLVNYPLYGVVGNRSSRAAVRKASSVRYADPKDGTKPVDIEKIRTIGFSNTLNDANLQGAWLGADGIAHYLSRNFTPRKRTGEILMRQAALLGGGEVFDSQGHLTAVGIQTLYQISPVFRDVTDFMALGLVLSHPQQLMARLEKARDAASIPILREIGDYVRKSVASDYIAASKLVLATVGSTPYLDPTSDKLSACVALRQRVLDEALPHLAETLTLKQAYGGFAELLRDRVILQRYRDAYAHEREAVLSPKDHGILSNLFSGTLTLRHGRYFPADDTHYKVAYARACTQLNLLGCK